jgi:RNA polymerase sigma-70 factor (ECF subfamily)
VLATLVERAQTGDPVAVEQFCSFFFDDIYNYAVAALAGQGEPHDMTQQIFLKVLAALPGYKQRRGVPFRAWLFRIARNAVMNEKQLHRHRREVLEPPMMVNRRREALGPDTAASVWRGSWLDDPDLQALVDRLPVAQREVLLLRHGFDFTIDQIATVMDRTPEAVAELQRRALVGLEQRLGAIRARRERLVRRSPMRLRYKPARVIVTRRFALERPLLSQGFYSPIIALRQGR